MQALLSVYGEIVEISIIKDKATGESKGLHPPTPPPRSPGFCRVAQAHATRRRAQLASPSSLRACLRMLLFLFVRPHRSPGVGVCLCLPVPVR